MKVACKSDVGKQRKNNEDSCFADAENDIFLLADGMGGHQGGEVASDLAAKEAYAHLKDKINQTNGDKDIFKLLSEAMYKAHDAIKEKAKADYNLTGMGTTLVEMVIKDGRAYFSHVGDSRAYIIREQIKQITKDQTVGDYLVDNNIMTREQIHPQKWHTLTQAVGVSETPVPELYQMEVQQGDFFLLCSDGLTDMLNDGEIEEVIKKYGKNVNKVVDMLVKAANKKGGRDNITVVLVKCE